MHNLTKQNCLSRKKNNNDVLINEGVANCVV